MDISRERETIEMSEIPGLNSAVREPPEGEYAGDFLHLLLRLRVLECSSWAIVCVCVQERGASEGYRVPFLGIKNFSPTL